MTNPDRQADRLLRPKTTGYLNRSDVLAKVDAVLQALSRPLTRQERRAGWSEEGRLALLDYFETAKARLQEPRPLQAEEFPADWQTLRGLDAWGIDIGSKSPLLELLLDVSSDLRRLLASELRMARASPSNPSP